MKLRLLISLLISYTSVFAQDASSEGIISALKLKVEQSENGEKLKWMDSLSNYSFYETRIEDTSILKETIAFALKLDSLNIATWHTGNLINYNNNTKGDPKEGNRIFIDFMKTITPRIDPGTLAKFYIEGGDTFYYLADHRSAIKNYELAESNAIKAKNNRYLGLAKLYKGGSQSFLGNFPEASQSLQEASKLFQKEKDTFNIISAKNSLSILYSQNAFFKEAKAERDEAIKLANKIEQLRSFNFFLL